ncbi:MAG: hypothetical protein EBR82_25845 [Caulobacteraceae bacterium]|nr:hypothetical protein [Caulobacteraceae bacterium]
MDGSERSGDGSLSLGILAQVLAASIFCVFLAAVAAALGGVVGAVAVCVVILLAAFAVGALLGFIFGVPRAVTDPSLAEAVVAAPAKLDAPPAFSEVSPPRPAPAAVSRRRLQSNTNLEKISDWLTTLLIGAGLVQLHAVGGALYGFQIFLSATFEKFVPISAQAAGLFAIIGSVLLVFGLCTGFLFMYLSTRLVLIKVFQLIELIIAGERTSLPEEVRSAIERSANKTGLGDFVSGNRSEGPTVSQGINLMFDLLYKENPKQVIDLGASLLYTSAKDIPEYWFYLAAAFGQQETKAKAEGDIFGQQSARDNALDCARRAVSLDSTFRSRLWSISNPEGPDDDLAGLRDDPEFQRLVGTPDAYRQ